MEYPLTTLDRATNERLIAAIFGKEKAVRSAAVKALKEEAKAALVELGIIDSAAVRLPLVESPPEHLELLRTALVSVAAR